MSRPLNSFTADLLADQVVHPIILVELSLESSPLYLTSATSNVTWNGTLFLGNGWLIPPDGISESSEIGNYTFDLTLSGVNLAVVAAILSNPDRGEPGSVWLAMCNQSNQIVGDPIMLYKGLVDSCEIDDKLENPYVIVHLVNDLARFDTSQNYRFTAQSHAAYYPDDLGFQYVTQLESWNGFWGKAERPKWLRPQKSRKRT